MTATFTKNRMAALSAAWWLFEGATVFAILADTTGAATAPALTDDMNAWLAYALSEDYDVVVSAGTADYGASITDRAEIPQIQLDLNYATSVTYTDVIVLSFPAVSPGAGAPEYSVAFLGVIHEDTAYTLTAGNTKTYKLDLYSQWI